MVSTETHFAVFFLEVRCIEGKEHSATIKLVPLKIYIHHHHSHCATLIIWGQSRSDTVDYHRKDQSVFNRKPLCPPCQEENETPFQKDPESSICEIKTGSFNANIIYKMKWLYILHNSRQKLIHNTLANLISEYMWGSCTAHMMAEDRISNSVSSCGIQEHRPLFSAS